MQWAKTQLRDKVTEQLLDLGILEPFQIVALNVNDVGHDNSRLFLRARCREHNADEYVFKTLPAQVQTDLEAFLADGLPLYEKLSEALFPNRFGRRMTTRNLRMRHQRKYGIGREIVKVGEPAGIEGVQWFNLWNHAEVIYFAQSKNQLIKIGHSYCFSQRFTTLESENGQIGLLGLVEGTKDNEARILNQFRHLLVRGNEWFRPAKELLDFINRANIVGREVFGKWNGAEMCPPK